jgi:DNA-binding GntR family transcriptional regulator
MGRLTNTMIVDKHNPPDPGIQSPIPRSRNPVDCDSLLSTIEHENLEDRTYARLRTVILTRGIAPGERIQPDLLARQMGVSRTPVLNALRRLAHEHIVDWVPRRGVFLKRYSKREFARLFEVREMLEALSARLAATRIPLEEVDRFAAMFRDADPRPSSTVPAEYIEQDRSFHARLIEVSGNPFLEHAMNALSGMIFSFQLGLRPRAETNQEHMAILDALRRRDPDSSEVAMRSHIRRSREMLDREGDAEESAAEEAPELPATGSLQ